MSKIISNNIIKVFDEVTKEVNKYFPSLVFNIKYTGKHTHTLKDRWNITIEGNDNYDDFMSILHFSLGKSLRGKDYIHIELSETHKRFREISLNSILRVILCKMAHQLEINVTSEALSKISAKTLCTLGFEDPHDNTTCDKFKTIQRIEDPDIFDIDVGFILFHGRFKEPNWEIMKTKFETSFAKKLDMTKPFCDISKALKFDKLAYRHNIIDILLIKGVYDTFEIVCSNDKRVRILGIPFMLSTLENAITISPKFNHDNFIGMSIHTFLLVKLCNICVHLKIRMYIYTSDKNVHVALQSLRFFIELETVNRAVFDPRNKGLVTELFPFTSDPDGFALGGGYRKKAASKKKRSSKPAAATGKVHTGPRGGKFVMRNGHKVYV